MPGNITIRFHHRLNDLLPAGQKECVLDVSFSQAGSIKDVIENLGIPHTEIGLILANSHAVAFDYLVQHGDRIEAYPETRSSESSHAVSLRPPLPEKKEFILDTHLGRLASYLRMLGFDALYRNDYADPQLADISANENRILLTCDRYLLMRKIVTYGYFVRSRQPRQQLLEILERYQLFDNLKPFTRCIRCNGLIEPVAKEVIENQLLPETRRWYNEFWQCVDCDHIYWKGSHYLKMKKFIRNVVNGDC